MIPWRALRPARVAVRAVAGRSDPILTPSGPGTLGTQQTRNTSVVRRMYPMRLWKEGDQKPIYRKKDQIYIAEDNGSGRPAGDMDVLLLKDLEGVGSKGKVVTIPKRIARNRLMPAGVAVYDSPENRERYGIVDEQVTDEIAESTKRTLRQLEHLTMRIPMSATVPWALTTNHMRLALRKLGIIAPETAILLPRDPITEPGEFKFIIRVNNKHDVHVPAVVYHFNKEDPDPSHLPKVWTKSKQTLADALKKLDITA